ncbi:MAG: hypothetical protein AMXMBFR84_22360 [Candidatus Hydrogenedentota bacterium]
MPTSMRSFVRYDVLSLVIWIVFLACASYGQEQAQGEPVQASHVKVYYEPGMFGGWPANHGIWIWGNEILVGFSKGHYLNLGDRHHIDRDKPERHMLARSLDGGESWAIEDPNSKGMLMPEGDSLHGTEIPGVAIPPLEECPGGIDFTHPDFAFTTRMNSVHAGVSRFYYSYDRGHVWQGPFRLPNFDLQGTAARTDYIVDGPGICTVFSTAAKSNGREGRPFCMRTTDGGKSWEFLSFIGPEIDEFSIMPSSVRLSETELVSVVRVRTPDRRFNSTYHSADNGKTWTYSNDPMETLGEGNPPSLIKLKDGRLCLTYGYRAEPFSMCAKLSDDGGRTWGKEIVLRKDGASRDIGYPRSVQRPDGKVVVVYYFNDATTGPERYIGATIWDPSVLN